MGNLLQLPAAAIKSNQDWIGLGALAVALVAGLFWFNRRGRHDDDSTSSQTKKSSFTCSGDEWENYVVNHHGPLRRIYGDSLFIIETEGCPQGPPVRNMIIYRIPDGSRRLIIFNGIALPEPLMTEIESLGTPRILVVPNSMHKCCAAVYQKRYASSSIKVVCPPAAQTQAKQIVPIHATTLDIWCNNNNEWSEWIQAKEIDGWAPFETILEFSLDTKHSKKAMVVADLLFTLRRNPKASFMERFMEQIFDSNVDREIVLSEAKGTKQGDSSQLSDVNTKSTMVVPKISRIARLFAIQDWKKAEQWYQSYAQNEGRSIAVIAVGHGDPVVEVNASDGCQAALEGVAEQLSKPRW